jgi:hypothetical protein
MEPIDPESPGRVQFGISTLPAFYRISFFPDPVPEEDENWHLHLALKVIPYENNSRIFHAEAYNRDLVSAVDHVRGLWPISTWKRWAHMVLLVGGEYLADGKLSASTPQAEVTHALSQLTSSPPRVRRRTSVTDDHLQEVAITYLNAPHKPTLAVKEHFHTSHSTAARWVGLARKAGLIPPASE